MHVADILKVKGHRVSTIQPHTPVAAALDQLKAENVGALVVTRDDANVLGIMSERDIVRCLATHGHRLMDMTVSEIMTHPVRTCTPDDSVAQIMSEMTHRRIRHMPVMDKDDRLCGIISIGDVVKNRLDEVESEAGELRNAFVGGYSATSASLG